MLGFSGGVMKKFVGLAFAVAAALLQSPVAAQQQAPPFVRDPKIPIDAEYTAKIKEYTTEPFFNSPLTDYLPASKTVPTPKAVLGDIAGAPGKLPYAEEVYDYMRLLEKASPRVKVFSIGKTEEGREMIAVAVAVRSRSSRSSRRTARASRSSPIRARSTWTMRRPKRSSPRRRRSTTSPARFTRRRPARRRR